MNEFLKTLLSLSLSGTLLFLLVLLPKRLYRERFSRRWQYYIWIVVALRFLLPFSPGVTFTSYLFDRAEAAISAVERNAVFGESDGAQSTGGQADYADGTPGRQADRQTCPTEIPMDRQILTTRISMTRQIMLTELQAARQTTMKTLIFTQMTRLHHLGKAIQTLSTPKALP